MPDDSASARSVVDRSKSGISRAQEKQIAKSLSPAIGWPTLALAVILPLTFAAVVALGLSDRLSLWICLPILTIVSYAHYTLVHESVHSNVVAAPSRFTWVNTLTGWIGALGMGSGWPPLQRTHVLHHSHTNTERDPDIAVKGTLLQLIRKWAIGLPFSLLPMIAVKFIAPARFERMRKILSMSEILQTSAVTLVTLTLLVVALATGHFADWLMLWFLPTRFGVLILNIFFQWLPHYPFDRTDRYGNTRISLWAGGTFLTLQQNLHLMHHLWPSVPFYNYARLYRALKPVLIEEGSRIEGLGVGPYAKARG